MTIIAAITNGAAPTHFALTDRLCAEWITRSIYLPDLIAEGDPAGALNNVDALIIPARLHRDRLHAARHHIINLLDRGGTVVVFGDQPVYRDQPVDWLPGIDWEHRPTNYWWWLDPNHPVPAVAAAPDHDLFQFIDITDATWHYHGILHPPADTETLIASPDGDVIAYIDTTSTPGTLIVTTLDPIYHHGSFFMPAATRFLTGFLPWLSQFAGSDTTPGAERRRARTVHDSHNR